MKKKLIYFTLALLGCSQLNSVKAMDEENNLSDRRINKNNIYNELSNADINKKRFNLKNNNIDHDAISRALTHPTFRSGLTKIDFSNNKLTSNAMLMLSLSPELQTLRELKINNNPIGNEGVSHVFASHFTNLQTLELDGTNITDAALVSIARGPFINIRTLSLKENYFTQTGAIAMAGFRFRLNKLSLDSTGVNDFCLQHITQSPNMQDIQILSLNSNNLGDETASYISGLRNLEELYLSNNRVSGTGIGSLVSSQTLRTKLKILDLSNNYVDDDVFLNLVNTFSLQRLESLDVSQLPNLCINNTILYLYGIRPVCLRYVTNAGIGALVENRRKFSSLKKLGFRGHKITSDGIENLVLSSLALNLEILDVGYNIIGNDGAVAITGANFNNLQKVYLDGNIIDNAGAQSFSVALRTGKFPRIQHISLANNRISEQKKGKIRRSNQNRNIHIDL